MIVMKAGFFQTSPVFGDVPGNVSKVLGVLDSAEADLIVLPELFATGYQFLSRDEAFLLSEPVPRGPTSRALIDLSSRKGMYVVAGLAERCGKKVFNSAILAGPEGFVGVYRKTHLYLQEKLWFEPGDTGFRVFETALGRIGIMICFDWFFPESTRTLALRGADIVAHPANLVLPWCPSAMPVRCLENHVFAITANRTGSENRRDTDVFHFIGTSQITGPDGSVLVRAQAEGESLSTSDMDLSKARDKSMNPYNDVFGDRRPELYGTSGS